MIDSNGANYKDPHNTNNTYTWYDSNPVTNGGNAGTPGNGTTTFSTEDFIKSLNSAHFGGYSDWRMPTINELNYIVNYGTYSPSSSTTYFTNTISSWYWSSTTNDSNTASAWFVDFSDGHDIADYGKNNDYHVRAVRGGKTVPAYVDNLNGTVTDASTGLIWQQGSAENTKGTNVTMHWGDALSYCENLKLGGYSDWRLPTQKELLSLVDFIIPSSGPSINPTYFTNTSSYWYWSSTTDANHTIFAWYVDFSNGNNSSYPKGGDFYVRAVRGGQAPTPAQACTATLNNNLSLNIPYLSYNNGAMTLSADLVYYPNPTYPTLIPFKLSNYAILNNPSFSCTASTLSSDLKIHIPDVLFPDGVTHIWVDLAYSPALSTGGNYYWVVTNYGTVSN